MTRSKLYGNSHHDPFAARAPVMATVQPRTYKRESDHSPATLSFLAGLSLAFLLLGLPILAELGGGSLAGYRALLAAAMALVFQVALWASGRAKLPDRLAFALLLLAIQMIIFAAAALARSGRTEYGVWKLQGFCIFALFPVTAIAFNYVFQQRRIKHLLIGFFLMAVAAMVVLPAANPSMLDPAHTVELLYGMGGNPIPLSRGLGTAALLAIVCSTIYGGWRRYTCVCVASVLVIGQFVLGERGPILALLIALVAIPKSLKRRVQIIVLIVTAVCLAIAVDLEHPNQKFTLQAVESDSRIEIMMQGLQTFAEQPLFGAGLGYFYLPSGNREYFHNLEGELATETGLLGLVVFLGFLFVLWQCKNRVRTPQTTFTLALAVYWLAAAQVSGDIVSNSMCWVTAMLWACSQFRVRQELSTRWKIVSANQPSPGVAR